MNNLLLVLNAGSSSLKFSIFENATIIEKHLRGSFKSISTCPQLSVVDADGIEIKREDFSGALTHEQAAKKLISWLNAEVIKEARITSVAHRVVHGGERFISKTRVDETIIGHLESLIPLAPLHQPQAIAVIKEIRTLLPEAVQYAFFDTAFHSTQSEVASTYALPKALRAKGIRRYGFHGISYQYVMSELRREYPSVAKGKVIIAHLGNGASMCAVSEGKSVSTTMGFSTLDGLVMGTRSGAIDPGVILYMLDSLSMTSAEVSNTLYAHSGLLGLSSVSEDMEVLLKDNSREAKFAIEVFTAQALRSLGSLIATNEGIDALVFTGGIGENSIEIRERICKSLTWLGIELDKTAEMNKSILISSQQSKVPVLVIKTDEELLMAKELLGDN